MTRPVREDKGGYFFTDMTDNDKELIAKAEQMFYCDWMYVLDMCKLADTEEARKTLKLIAMHKMHKEEHSCGTL